jgi:hypothetical protein
MIVRTTFSKDPTLFCDYLPFEQFWGKSFLKIFSKFLLFCYYLPLGNGVVLHLYNSEFPLPKDDLCQVRLKLAQWFWRRSWKYKCSTDTQMTDNERSENLTWAFSSGELKINHFLFFHVQNEHFWHLNIFLCCNR